MNQKENITQFLQPSGIAALWISIGLVALGLFTSSALLLTGVLGLLLFPFCKWLGRLQLSGLEFTRKVPIRVFSGEQFEIDAEITNRNKQLHISDLSITDSMSDANSRAFSLPFLGKRSSLKTLWYGRLFRRGWNDQNEITVTSLWPLGLFESRLATCFQSDNDSSDGGGVLVVPRPLIPDFLSRTLEQLDEQTSWAAVAPPDSPTEFRYLREFRSGDAIKSIHWPGSVRSGKLFIKETDPPIPKPSCHGILLHSFVPAGEIIRNDQFEVMLRIATGLVIHAQKQKTSLLFSASFADGALQAIPDASGYSAVLDQIARAAVSYNSNIKTGLSDLAKMDSCDQVFVLGCSPIGFWEDEAKEILPSCICIDPDGMTKKTVQRKLILNR